MEVHGRSSVKRHQETKSSHDDHTPRRFMRRWLMANTLVAGFFALCWLLLRSGAKPSRLAYPCQQAAMSAAALAFGVPLVSALMAGRRRVIAGFRTPVGVAVAAFGLLLTAGVWGYVSRANTYRGPVLDPPEDYRAQVFHVSNCPQDPVGDRFLGLDDLLVLMGRNGLKFYRSANETTVSGSAGIIASDDVVLVKVNYQWPERGGTNTDLLRGLIQRIVDHPDTFTGEIVVCENSQYSSTHGFDRSDNNAQNPLQSPHDLVVDFAARGFRVSHYAWTAIRSTAVDEYVEGDVADGYVVYPWDSDINGRVSYPKFQTGYGTQISLKYGLWDSGTETYSRQRLKFINLPVLKSHHAVYGMTACVKHYMGVVSGALDTNSHNAIRSGILGALLSEIRLADLNILDAIWINANPNSGPWSQYDVATRRDELLASVDPVAADLWAAENILIPAFVENGFSPPWPSPSADPDDPGSAFRTYLDNSMNQILAAGYNVTNDPGRIDLFTWSGADFEGDGDVDADDFAWFAQCYTGPGGGPVISECEPGDFNGDGDVDCDDWVRFVLAWTQPGSPPALLQCPCSPSSPPQPEAEPVAKNRYVSLGGNNSGLQTAIRVKAVDLPVPFDVWNNRTWFVGMPEQVCENSGQGRGVPIEECGSAPGLPREWYWAAALECEPANAHFDDWGTYDVVHLYHEGLVPGGVYNIQAVAQGCSLESEDSYSTSFTLTQAVWSDVCGPGPSGACSGPPDGVVDVTNDVLGVLDKFANIISLQKARADLEPGDDGVYGGTNNGPDLKVNVANDVLYCLDAFTGAEYPFEPGDPCNPG